MLVAWVGTCFSASFVAHFMKHVGPLWFTLHVSLQTATLLLTVAGAVAIFSKHDFEGDTHQSLGITIMVLSVVQVSLGLLRNKISGEPTSSDPDDHGPRYVPFPFPPLGAVLQLTPHVLVNNHHRRWVFNMLHWAVGWLLLALPMAAVYTGLGALNADDMAFTVYYVWMIGALVIIVVSLLGDLYAARTNLPPIRIETFKTHAGAVFMAWTMASAVALLYLVSESRTLVD